jgi:hypothetical protein
MASLFVLSLMISAICTAWPWWTIMSRAKASLGGVVVGRQGGQQHRQRDACGQDGHDGEQHEWSVVPIGWGAFFAWRRFDVGILLPEPER